MGQQELESSNRKRSIIMNSIVQQSSQSSGSPSTSPTSSDGRDVCRSTITNPLNLNLQVQAINSTGGNNSSSSTTRNDRITTTSATQVPIPLNSNLRRNDCVIEPSNRMVVNTNSLRSRSVPDPANPYTRTEFDFNLLKSEQARLDTFHCSTCRWPLTFISPEDCAKAGFFFLKDGDKVQCAFCRGVAGEWELGDVPMNEHKKHFPRCPFLCNLPVGNIPIGQTAPTIPAPQSAVDPSYGFDVCGPFLPPGFANSTDSAIRGAFPLNQEPIEDVARNLAINTGTGPARRHLVTLQARLKTFKDWPTNSGQAPEKMADAGFFFIGTQDHVKCFYCDGGLRNWEPGDDPWFEHARWFSKCPFVLLMKGHEYVREVGNMRPPVPDSDSDESASSSQEPHTSSSSEPESGDEIERLANKATASRTNSGSDSGLSDHNTSGEQAWSSDDEATSPVPTAERKVDLEEEIRKLKEARQCKICMDNEVSVVFLPCGHLVSCVSCATALATCALCREPIKAVIRTYMS